jgi:hypothetical protein
MDIPTTFYFVVHITDHTGHFDHLVMLLFLAQIQSGGFGLAIWSLVRCPAPTRSTLAMTARLLHMMIDTEASHSSKQNCSSLIVDTLMQGVEGAVRLFSHAGDNNNTQEELRKHYVSGLS